MSEFKASNGITAQDVAAAARRNAEVIRQTTALAGAGPNTLIGQQRRLEAAVWERFALELEAGS